MLPQNDQQRLTALHHYGILDTPQELTFDLVTKMLAEMLGVPHACISLVDRERVWFKSAFGVEAPEVQRELGFCATLITSDEEIRYIEDAASHPETRHNSLVTGPPRIRFYAGAPLSTVDGHRIGTLCAFGPQPRELNETERLALSRLASLVMNEIELRYTRRELHRTEAVLRQSQRLENVGMVASGIAHDFNNLLGGMLGHAELLQFELDGQEKAQALLAKIRATGKRAVDLVRQMLTYAGHEEDGPREPIDLNSLIQSTHRMLGGSLLNGTQFHFQLEPDLPAVLGWATCLRQLAMNLMTNASEACGDGGNVWIRTQLLDDQQTLLFTVSDDGHGMAAELRERIFEPFFSTKTNGRGLGLAITCRIVDRHEGTIDVDSEIDQGTTFQVRLPACHQQPRVREAARPESAKMGDGLIMVVDDEPAICDVARQSLEIAGYEVLIADGGEKAIEMLDQGHDVSVMLLDWSMPGVSGDRVLEALHQRRLNWPVVLSSGHTEATAREASTFKIAGFLSKPYTLHDLVSKIQSAQQDNLQRSSL